MQDSKVLLDQARQQVASSQLTQIPAGQKAFNEKNEKSEAEKAASIDAINQIFAEFELVYHNQFNKAFSTVEKLQYAKTLWFRNLSDYSAEQIVNAAHKAIKSSEYLPTVRGLLKHAEDDYASYGLLDPRSAYVEACNKGSPKANALWSHPVAYYAGVASDWFFLANNIESKAFPVYKSHYDKLCQRLRHGETFDSPAPKSIEQQPASELSHEEQVENIKNLRATLKL